MNQFIGVGNLVRTPEEIVTGDGMHITTFSLAINRIKGKDGTSKADYIPIKVFGKRAETCAKYLDKGSKVAVHGMISTINYTAQDGTKRFKIEVLADNVEFLTPKGSRGESAGAGEEIKAQDAYTDEAADDDELPF